MKKKVGFNVGERVFYRHISGFYEVEILEKRTKPLHYKLKVLDVFLKESYVQVGLILEHSPKDCLRGYGLTRQPYIGQIGCGFSK